MFSSARTGTESILWKISCTNWDGDHPSVGLSYDEIHLKRSRISFIESFTNQLETSVSYVELPRVSLATDDTNQLSFVYHSITGSQNAKKDKVGD